MKKLMLLILIAIIGFSACSNNQIVIHQPAELGKVDERTELMSIIFRLMGAEEYSFNTVKQYTKDIDDYFSPVKNHEIIKFAGKLRNTNGISYDAVMSLAVNLKISGNKISLIDGIVESNIDKRWGMPNINKFVELLNDFYTVSKFHDFYSSHTNLYRSAEANFDSVLKQVDFNWFDKFYGEKIKGNFNIIISLVNRGSYGPDVKFTDKTEDIYSIIGPNETDSAGVPVYSGNWVHTIVHEFNHSYCNHLIDDNYSEMHKINNEFYTYVTEKMRRQAYGSAETMLRELLVRACAVKYFQAHNTDSGEIKLLINSEHANGFIWAGKLVALLDKYQSQRNKYPSLSAFMPEIIKLQNSLSPKDLFNEYSKNQPVITGSNIANNDENVDPDIKELIINFDRRMMVGKNGINYGSKGDQFFPKTISAKWNKETEDQWIISIELEPDREYSMVFPAAFYFDKEGNNLKETYYLNFKTRKK